MDISYQAVPFNPITMTGPNTRGPKLEININTKATFINFDAKSFLSAFLKNTTAYTNDKIKWKVEKIIEGAAKAG